MGARAAGLGQPQRDPDRQRPRPPVLRRRLGLQTSDQVGFLDGGVARFGRSYIGEPDVIAEELARDVAVGAADTLLVTVPNQLGVEYNTRLLQTIAEHVAPAVGWQPAPRR